MRTINRKNASFRKRIPAALIALLLIFQIVVPSLLVSTSAAYNAVMTAEQFISALQTALSRNTVYKNKYPYNLGYYDGSKISWDCWNLGKSIIWTKGAIVNNYTVGNYAKKDSYSGLGDWDGLTIIKKAPNCNGDFSALIPGEWLYMSGHTGYYIGNGQVIECTAGWGTYKVVQSQISTTGVRSRNGVKAGSWTLHGMVPWIDYSGVLNSGINTNDLTFDSSEYQQTIAAANNATATLTGDGLQILSTTTVDPFVELRNIHFSADTYKYLTFTAKTTYAGSGTQKVAFYLSAGATNYSTEQCKVMIDLPASGEPETVVVDLSSLPLWTGGVNIIRIDPFNDVAGAVVGEGIVVRRMTFSKTLAEAQACVPAQMIRTNDLTFDSSLYENALAETHNANMSLTADGLLITATGVSDPYVHLKNIRFSADTYKYLAFTAKTNYVGNGTQKVAFYLSAGDTTYATEQCKVVVDLPESGNPETIVVDLSALPLWTGDVNMIRIDPFNDVAGAVVGEGIVVRRMTFCRTLDEAQSYLPVTPGANAFYTVTASVLNVRSADNTSSAILTGAPRGAEVAVVGFNSDYSWAQVIYGNVRGWCSMQYLVHKEDFGALTVNYDLNGVEADPVSASVLDPFDTVTAGGEGLYSERYEFLGWTLSRASDGKSLCADGTWNASCADNRLFMPGDTLELGFANLNRAVTDDTYTFTAQWREIVIETAVPGDVNGDGVVNMRDLNMIKQYVASSITIDEIVAINTDIDGDGVINYVDMRLLKSMIAGA